MPSEVGLNYLSILKLQQCSHYTLGIDIYFHIRLYWAFDYFTMLGLKYYNILLCFIDVC